jgi:hypothetical protein
MRECNFGQRVESTSGHDADEFELVGVSFDHAQGIAADRPGGAEQHDLFAAAHIDAIPSLKQ